MICGASIAKRDGTHKKCRRSLNHLGDCDPRPPALRVRTGIVVPSRPPDRDYAIVAGAHLLLVLVVLLICCLSGCEQITAEGECLRNDRGVKLLVGCVCFGGGWLLAAFTRRTR